MKKSLLIVACLTLSLGSFAKEPKKVMTPAQADAAAEALKLEILESKSTFKAQGTIYYVSNDGKDSNDGKSLSAPLKSLSAVNRLALKSGDLVLFKRGDLWRGQVVARSGVTYSAYGEGPKPKIYGSPWDGAAEGTWHKTNARNVYVYSRKTMNDIGTLVFDDGAKGCAYKVMKRTMPNGDTFHLETGEPFESYMDLKRDLDMWHDSQDTGDIYLYSETGNPAERFKSIEFLTHGHCFLVKNCNDVTIDNLCIKYTGSHGIGSLSIDNFVITNCEFGWIGGSIQHYNPMKPEGTKPTRYGNAVEIWGGCDHYVIDHCWAYQIYDAGLTFQFRVKDKAIKMKDITFSNNLVEDCVYCIEYFLTPSEDKNVQGSIIEDARFTDNILRRAGYGWGRQRPDKSGPACIKAWRGSRFGKNASRNFVISGNIFDRGYPMLLDVHAANPDHVPVFTDNVYLQKAGVETGTIYEKNAKVTILN